MTRTSPTTRSRVTARRTYVVACLAGHGIGPEITAAASRALARPRRASTASTSRSSTRRSTPRR